MSIAEYTLQASAELKALRNFNIIKLKGKGNATYYVLESAFLGETLQAPSETLQARLEELRARPTIVQALTRLKRHTKRNDLISIIVDLCQEEPLKSVEIAGLLNRNETYLRTILVDMVGENGPLAYTIPEMPTHPNQAYKCISDRYCKFREHKGKFGE